MITPARSFSSFSSSQSSSHPSSDCSSHSSSSHSSPSSSSSSSSSSSGWHSFRSSPAFRLLGGLAIFSVAGVGSFLIARATQDAVDSFWQAVRKQNPQHATAFNGVLACSPSEQSRLFGLPISVACILGLNLVVFGLHYVAKPQWMFAHFFTSWDHVFKVRYFHTLLTNVFSHSSVTHLAFNCIAFASISPLVVSVMGDKHFTAFYLGAGVVSSFIGNIISVFAAPAGRHRSIARARPALGASGAIFAILGVIWLIFPERQYTLFLIPKPFRADEMVPTLGLFDMMGIVYDRFCYRFGRQPSPLGHGAHFSGLVFGYSYAKWGPLAQHPWVRKKMKWNQYMAKIQAEQQRKMIRR